MSDVIDKIGFPTKIVELEGNKIYNDFVIIHISPGTIRNRLQKYS